jgi:hypothetical protein
LDFAAAESRGKEPQISTQSKKHKKFEREKIEKGWGEKEI